MLEQIRPIVEQQLKLETAECADASEVAILAAVSGGLDSMVLLDLLHRLSLETGFRLAVAHLDHQRVAETRPVRQATHQGRCRVQRSNVRGKG